jgi:O-antigen ligase
MGVAVLGIAALHSAPRHRVPPSAWVIWAMASIPLMQWSVGLFPYFMDAFLPAVYLLGFGVAIVISGALHQQFGERYLSALWLSVLAAAVVSTGIALTQAAQLGPISWIEFLPAGQRPFGNLAQPNHLATLLLWGMTSVIWLFERRRLGAGVAAMASMYLSFGVVITQSRTAWLVLAVVCVGWIVMRRRIPIRTPQFALAIGCAAFALATFAWPTLYQLAMQGGVAGLEARLQPGTRLDHWSTLLDAAGQRPWAGYGWGQIGLAQQNAALTHPPTGEWLSYSHNIVLDLILWAGMPIGLGLTAACLAWLYLSIKSCRDVSTFAAITAITAVGIHSLLEYPLAYTYFLLPLGLFIGVVDSAEPVARNPAWAFPLPRLASAAILSLLGGVLFWVCSEYIDAEESERRLRLKEAGYVVEGDPPTAPNLRLLDGLAEFQWVRLVDVKENMDAVTLDRMKSITTRYAPPGALLTYATAAALNGRSNEARVRLALLCKLWVGPLCDQGRQHWAVMQKAHPKLQAVDFPQ